MIWFLTFVALRLPVAAFFLLTCGYALAVHSPFAFEMLIRPGLLPGLSAFVAWHHVWYVAAYVAAVVTLLPDLMGSTANDAVVTTTRWAARAYVVVFGIAGAYLLSSPILPTLWNDSRSFAPALVSLCPLAALAVIDHLAAWRTTTGVDTLPVGMGQRRLLVACVIAAGYIWAIHLARALLHATTIIGTLSWVTASAWALALDTTAFMAVYLLLSLVATIAARRRMPRVWEHGLTVALAAAAICEFLRRTVLSALSFDSADAVKVSVVIGVVSAAMWSGLAVRSPAQAGGRRLTGMEMLLAPRIDRLAPAIAVLAVLPFLTFALLDRVERLDWDFVLQKTVLVCECTLAFGLLLRVCARIRERSWSAPMLVVPPLLALACAYGIPRVAATLATRLGDSRLGPDVVLDRYAAADLSFRLMADGLVQQVGFDADYHRYLLRAAATADGPSTTMPKVEFSVPLGPPISPRPHVFLMVIDSLRRDYLSPYNPAVDFTPNLERFSRDSFLFGNAFTRYGGTWLAMPSIWTGGAVTRRWGTGGFDRLNALEKLITADGYRVVINDYTVAQHLRSSTPVTRLDPGIPSVETDLCHLVGSLEAHLDASASDPRPVFAYLAPMNVHILNTRPTVPSGDAGRDRWVNGFYAPYAAALKRVDACFGSFIANLQRRGIYDNSIIVVTSDHGDSLGERGNWGHQYFLYPEDVRLPLIVHIPAALRPALTVDLGRVTFTTDIAPTLYALLGHQVRSLGPAFGEPLFVPADRAPASRRRESFLLMSSYGPTYGILTRNGQFLYISDLINWRETAMDMSRTPLGEQVAISDELRRVSQRQIRERVAEVVAFYHPTP